MSQAGPFRHYTALHQQTLYNHHLHRIFHSSQNIVSSAESAQQQGSNYHQHFTDRQNYIPFLSSGGAYHGFPVSYLPRGTQNLMSLPVLQIPNPAPSPVESAHQNVKPKLQVRGQSLEQTARLEESGSEDSMAVTGDETEAGPAGDLTACQLRGPSSSLPQGLVATSSQCSHSLDASEKRMLRLLKNREAARLCRRKKKEYVRCLENRVAVLEHQNKTLIEELRALKDVYRHKVD